MMFELVEEQAKRLKLSHIRNHCKHFSAEELQFLSRIFTQEIEQRDQNRINLILKQAQLPPSGEEEYRWEGIQLPSTLDRHTLLEAQFINNAHNLILYGGVGTGKTYLSKLIALNAIRKFGHRVKFYTTTTLVNELLASNLKGALGTFLNRIERLDFLILDELGYIPLSQEGAELLFQVITLCYQRKSIIITTNLQFSQWNHIFGNQILTEAVIDRLIHHSHFVLFTGDSHRYQATQL